MGLVLHFNMKAFIAIIACLVAYASAEAEAEADPAVLYASAYHPYGYYGYGKSAPCVNAANVPVPCAGRKRREAEADPAVFYSGLGLAGYGLGYGGLYGAGLYGAGVVAGA